MSTRSRIEMESHKDPQTLEREIDLKRAEISGTVAALEHKLSPGELFERALGFARGNGREFADNLGASVKANPLPMLLTTVGLAWMMLNQGRGAAVGYHADDPLHGDSATGEAGLRAKAAELKARAAGGVGHARERASATTHRAGDAVHRAGDAVRHRAADARNSLEVLMREQPLAIGAMGIALGAMLGAMLPSTRREDELLGSASDKARSKAKELAGSGLERANEQLARRGSQQAAGNGSGGGRSADRASPQSPPF